MTIEKKKKLINQILTELNNNAILNKKPFDFGDSFFALAFKEDRELIKIAKLLNIH